MNAFTSDLRYAVRLLGRNPGFTVVAVVTLALGIGAITAIFSVVNGVLLRPLSISEPQRVLSITETHRERGWSKVTVTGPNFEAWRSQSKSFTSVAAYMTRNVELTGRGEPQEAVGAIISREFFDLTGGRPVAGRLFLREEFAASPASVVVIGERYWRSALGADAGILGKTLTVNGTPRTVVGIAPSAWPLDAELFFPFPEVYRQMGAGNHMLFVMGRLHDDARRETALMELGTIAERLAANDPAATRGWSVDVEPLLDTVVGNVRRSLYVLLGAVGFVLLIVCANISSLLYARASARAQEIAVRNALGASRRRVVRQLLTESFLVTAIGGALGGLVAVWGVALLQTRGPVDTLPRLSEVTVDASVLWFSVGVAILSGLLVGLAPALRASSWRVHESLKSGGRTSTDVANRKSRQVLVVAELAFATMLLVGAGLMTRSLINLVNIPLGFDGTRVIALDLDMPGSRYDRPKLDVFVRQLEERLRALPGVQAVGTTRALPLESGGPDTQFDIVGRPSLKPGEAGFGAFYTPSSPSYLPAMRVQLLQGRYLQPSDDRREAPRVVVINETMARRFWPDGNAVGARLRLPDSVAAEVVGVVKDVRQRRLRADVAPAMWVPWSHYPETQISMVIRTIADDPATIVPAAKRAVWALDPMLPVESWTMEWLRNVSLGEARFQAWLFGGFAFVALILATLGIYALVAYSVTLRTREIGLRIALGAQSRQVERMIVANGAVLAATGLGIGVLGALWLTKSMGTVLYQVPTRDLASLVIAVGTLAAAALLASWIPARRAARVEPGEALRWTE